MTDVTDAIDQEGAAERERQAQERASAVKSAAELLKVEILRREAEGEPAILRKRAEEFLTSRGIKQKIAREAIKSPAFEAVEVDGKGHPRGVRLAADKDGFNRNTTPAEPAPGAASRDGDFSHPHPERITEINSLKTQCLKGSQGGGISVEDTLFAPTVVSPTRCEDVLTPSPTKEAQGTEEDF